MTYREKIQQMILQINTLYEEAEWLRDFATSEEKEYWNAHRKIFYDAAGPLQKLDNKLSQSRANTCVCDDIDVTKKYHECPECHKLNNIEVCKCKDCGDQWTRDNYCNFCEQPLNFK